MVQCTIYGFIKPPGCKNDVDLKRDDLATPILDKWFSMLEEGASYAEVADYLNTLGIPTGKYCRTAKWSGKMVRRITFNPLLKGVRRRNEYHTVKHHGSGHRISRKAPPEMLKTRDCPHLRHIEPERYDRVIQMLKLRNAQYRRKPLANGDDPLLNRRRKRSAWPGQHCYCGVCGRMLVYGAHGQNHHLVCSGTADYKCWNAIGFDGPLGSRKLIEAIVAAIEMLPEFDDIFQDQVNEALQRRHNQGAEQVEMVEGRLKNIDRQIDNIVQVIAQGTSSTALTAKLAELEVEKNELSFRRDELRRASSVKQYQLPSLAHIKEKMRQCLAELPTEGAGFARLMKTLIERIIVRPYQLVDGGRPVLRAEMTLNLVSLASLPRGIQIADEVLTKQLQADLFDHPQREAIRKPLLALLAAGGDRNLKRLAAQLPTTVTTTAVQRSLKLIRTMQTQGLTDPYIPITDPDEASHISRHRHARYRFEPLPGTLDSPAQADTVDDCAAVA
jgi:hypothetical protein